MAFIKRRLKAVKPRVLVTKGGEKLFKRVVCKVIIPKLKTMVHQFVAPAGKGYTEDDVYMIRARVIDHLDHKFPFIEFNEVEVGKDQFNYVACGARSMLQQPELTDGQRTEREGTDGGGGRSIAEQIADAISRGSGGREGDGQGDGVAVDIGEGGGSGAARGSGWNPGPDGSTEDRDSQAESTEQGASGTAATAAEEHPNGRADGVSVPEDLQDQGPQHSGS